MFLNTSLEALLWNLGYAEPHEQNLVRLLGQLLVDLVGSNMLLYYGFLAGPWLFAPLKTACYKGNSVVLLFIL
jgi:hypothetical protein